MQTQNTTSTYNFYTDFNNFKGCQFDPVGVEELQCYEENWLNDDLREYLNSCFDKEVCQGTPFEKFAKVFGFDKKHQNLMLNYNISFGQSDNVLFEGKIGWRGVEALIEAIYSDNDDKRLEIQTLMYEIFNLGDVGYDSDLALYFSRVSNSRFDGCFTLSRYEYDTPKANELRYFGDLYEDEELYQYLILEQHSDLIQYGYDRTYLMTLFDDFMAKANKFLQDYQQLLYEAGFQYLNAFYTTQENIQKMKDQWDALQEDNVINS